jgi:hypothetical protein
MGLDDDDEFWEYVKRGLKKEADSIQVEMNGKLQDIRARSGPVLRGPFKKWRAERRVRRSKHGKR